MPTSALPGSMPRQLREWHPDLRSHPGALSVQRVLPSQIQLELMYAYYKNGSVEQPMTRRTRSFARTRRTRASTTRCTSKRLSYFDDEPGFLERWFDRDDATSATRKVHAVLFDASATRRTLSGQPVCARCRAAHEVLLENRLADADENHRCRLLPSPRRLRRRAESREDGARGTSTAPTGNAESLRIMIVAAYEELGMTDLADDARRTARRTSPPTE